jgi:hypothetical protein
MSYFLAVEALSCLEPNGSSMQKPIEGLSLQPQKTRLNKRASASTQSSLSKLAVILS